MSGNLVSFPEEISLRRRNELESEARRRAKQERERMLLAKLAGCLAVRRVYGKGGHMKFLGLLRHEPAVFRIRSQPVTRPDTRLIGHVIANPARLPFLPEAEGVRWNLEK